MLRLHTFTPGYVPSLREFTLRDVQRLRELEFCYVKSLGEALGLRKRCVHDSMIAKNCLFLNCNMILSMSVLPSILIFYEDRL